MKYRNPQAEQPLSLWDPNPFGIANLLLIGINTIRGKFYMPNEKTHKVVQCFEIIKKSFVQVQLAQTKKLSIWHQLAGSWSFCSLLHFFTSWEFSCMAHEILFEKSLIRPFRFGIHKGQIVLALRRFCFPSSSTLKSMLKSTYYQDTEPNRKRLLRCPHLAHVTLLFLFWKSWIKLGTISTNSISSIRICSSILRLKESILLRKYGFYGRKGNA